MVFVSLKMHLRKNKTKAKHETKNIVNNNVKSLVKPCIFREEIQRRAGFHKVQRTLGIPYVSALITLLQQKYPRDPKGNFVKNKVKTK